MAARRYTTEEVAAIIMNLPCDGDESELSDFEGSEGDEGDATLNDQDEMDDFSDVSEEEAILQTMMILPGPRKVSKVMKKFGK